MKDNNLQDYLPGFAWAVPMAFADPVAACRFEQGDTFYDRAEAYSLPWSEARTTGRAIQVREPSRGIGGASSGQDDSAFADSWRQEVVFELHDLAPGARQTIATTQGRLFTLLWKDDVGVLEEGSPEPSIPLNAGKLKKHLEVAASRLDDGSGTVFAMATDLAAGLQREKLFKVASVLESFFGVRPELLDPLDLDLDAVFLPTARVARFTLGEATAEAVTETLQAVLYRPSADRKSEVSRFRLASHGLLLP